MKVYLPHYDNGIENSERYYEVSDACYTNLTDAIKEIEQRGYELKLQDTSKVDILRNHPNKNILPLIFEHHYSDWDPPYIAYIKEINLVEGDND